MRSAVAAIVVAGALVGRAADANPTATQPVPSASNGIPMNLVAPPDAIGPAREPAIHPHRVLIVATNGTSDFDLLYLWYRMAEEGFPVTLAGPTAGTIQCENGTTVDLRFSLTQIEPEWFDVLIIPGGPGALTLAGDEDMKRYVRHFIEQRKLIAAPEHGVRAVIEADVITGRIVAGPTEVQADVAKRGGTYVAQEIRVDRRLITSSKRNVIGRVTREIVRLALRENDPRK